MTSLSSRPCAVAYSLCMRVRLPAALAIALALATSACSQSEPAGAPAPPPVGPSPVAQSSSAPSPAAPSSAEPAPAATSVSPTTAATPFLTTADQAGAFAFVREYYRRLDDAYASGDVQPVAVMRTRTCSCRQAEQSITEDQRNGQRTVGYRHFIDEMQAGSSGPSYFKVGVQAQSSAARVEKAGTLGTSFPAATAKVVFTLIRELSTWVVDEVNIYFDKPSR